MTKRWRFSGNKCPKCCDYMIINNKGHECSSINCDYIETRGDLFMKTERQLYEEYIAAQLARLEKLAQEQDKVQKDITEVTKLMLQCPYEISSDD